MSFLKPIHGLCAGLLGLALLATAATAQTTAAAQPASTGSLLRLHASATLDVMQDWLSIGLAVSRDGADGAAVQQQLKQVLDAALVEARKAARPGQLEVRTSGFALHPRYSSRGGINGWSGRAELLLEGRDAQAIATLAARLTAMPVSQVSWSLSREAREKAETDLAAQAVGRFKAQADAYARLFGFSGYAIRDVEITGGDAPRVMPLAISRARATAAPVADEPIPVEAGKTAVSLSVSGQVQMTR
ncbi:MAG: SIMPL domain-containing protein [Aquabacterium sp.]